MNNFRQFFIEHRNGPPAKLQGYSKQGNVESALRERLGNSFIWFNDPKPISKVVTPDARGRLLNPQIRAFVLGYRPIKNLPERSKKAAFNIGLYDIQGDPSFCIVRVNHADKTLWGYYVWLPFFCIPNNPNKTLQLQERPGRKVEFSMNSYLHFPFELDGDDMRTMYHLNRHIDLIAQAPATLKMIDDYVAAINRGPEGYVEFFLRNPSLRHLDNNTNYKITVTKALAHEGLLKPTDVDDKMMVDLL